MAYQILRVKKLKSAGNVKASLEHLKRENGRAPNADKARTRLNEDSHSSVANAMARFEETGKDLHMQKNSVQALEYLVTASPKSLDQGDEWQDYFADAYDWIAEKHGKENLVFFSVQRDETTPHMSVIVRPVSERKFKNGRTQKTLSAKKFVDGRQKLSEMQTDFHEQIGSKFKLKRGSEKSTAKHTEIKQWYSETREAFGSGNFEQYLEKMRQLENLVLSLKQSKKRWRSDAQTMSKNWFEVDLENTKDQDVLKSLVTEIQESKVLPRAVKKNIVKSINDKITQINTPTKTRSRRK